MCVCHIYIHTEIMTEYIERQKLGLYNFKQGSLFLFGSLLQHPILIIPHDLALFQTKLSLVNISLIF